jgi:hypothetical protein
MTAQLWTAIFAGLALMGQVANLVLFLMIKVAQLQTEAAIVERTDCRYPAAAVCRVEMAEHERRIAQLETRR